MSIYTWEFPNSFREDASDIGGEVLGSEEPLLADRLVT
jgi:hypothetical protein